MYGDPWGLGNKLITRKIEAPRKPLLIIPYGLRCGFSIFHYETALSMKNKMAPGRNGILAKIYKLVFLAGTCKIFQFKRKETQKGCYHGDSGCCSS